MREFGLIVDSSVQSNFKEVIFKDATIVSLSFIMNDQKYLDNQINNEDLFIENKHKKVTLMNQKPEAFIQAINYQKSLGYEKVLLLLSANHLTNAYNQALLAKTILNDANIFILDSNTFGPGIQFLLEMLDYYVKKNLRLSEIIDKMNQKISQGKTIIITKDITGIKLLKSKFEVPRLLFPTNIISFNKSFKLEKQIISKKDIYKYLIKMILSTNDFGIKSYIKICYSTNVFESKVLHHELCNALTDDNVTLYGALSSSISLLFGKDAIGIYIGNEAV